MRCAEYTTDKTVDCVLFRLLCTSVYTLPQVNLPCIIIIHRDSIISHGDYLP